MITVKYLFAAAIVVVLAGGCSVNVVELLGQEENKAFMDALRIPERRSFL